MQIIHENEYEETMKNTVEPYLSARKRELYVPGADYPFRNENKRITGKIHMLQYLSDAPKGVVVISHGFTESAAKYAGTTSLTTLWTICSGSDTAKRSTGLH